MPDSESYTPGYSQNASDFMAQRTIESHGAFAIPLLTPGLTVLDCGCGPGTITAGIATLVAPGMVYGIDGGETQITLAKELATASGAGNVFFDSASVYSLPFPGEMFDVVFSHALFEHLGDPLEALAEIRRVLKPGGKVALRSPDWGGFVLGAESHAVQDAIRFYKQLQAQNGGDVYAGRKLKGYLRANGFEATIATASYECYEPVSRIAEYLAQRIDQAPALDKAVELEWATQAEIDKMAAGLRQWSQNPDALFAQAWFEAIGTKA